MKRTIFLNLIFIVICIHLFSQVSVQPGDVNEDNAVDIVDALLVAQYYVGLNPPDIVNIRVADINCDGSTDIVDALLIAQFYVGLIPEFPGCTETTAPTPLPTESPSPFPEQTPITISDPISLEDVNNNIENYVGENYGEFDIIDIQPTTIHDFYGNSEDGYSVYIRDEYTYIDSFYIQQSDYNIINPLLGQRKQFKLTGQYGPYTESHISGAPYLLSIKTNTTYTGMWKVYIELLL